MPRRADVIVVPVNLGCCPDAPRCILCPPPPAMDAELVEALVASYARDRAGPGDALEVRFFGGAPPGEDLLDAAGDLPITVRVRPDLLPRAEAERLAARSVHAVELDALTFDDAVLREAGRRYRRALLLEMSRGLAALGLRVGGVLAPGLPRSSHAITLADARTAAASWSFARLHPVLVLDGSGLRTLHEAGRYQPLGLGEAVTACHGALDVLEAAGVEVVRVGLQAGPDGFGRAVAGPRHPGLRELVEARRVLERLRADMAAVPSGSHVTIACAPADETRTRGMYNRNVRTLRAELRLGAVRVSPDPSLARGQFRLHLHEEIQ